MSTEIRRRRTGNAELDALRAIQQALDPLEEDEALRVLTWALSRYVPVSDEARHIRTLQLAAETVDCVREQTDRLQRIAAEMAGITDAQLANALKQLVELAESDTPAEPETVATT